MRKVFIAGALLLGIAAATYPVTKSSFQTACCHLNPRPAFCQLTC